VAIFRKDDSGLLGVKNHVRSKGVSYPVLYDAESKNPEALGICTYPRAFLLDKAGVVVWEGPLWKKNLPKIEGHIREILASKSPPRKATTGSPRIAYLSRKPGSQKPIVFTMKLDGSDRRALGKRPMAMTTKTLSPDGKCLVFASDRDGNQEIYTMGVDGKGQRRLTVNEAHDGSPSWSPDSKQIVFVSSRDGQREIYIMNADGSNKRRLTYSKGEELGPVWLTEPKGSRRHR